MTECTLCHQEIRWALTRAQGRIPLDLEPDPLRGHVFLHGEEATVLRRQDLRRAQEAKEELYRPHWETCPVAIKVRGKGRRG